MMGAAEGVDRYGIVAKCSFVTSHCHANFKLTHYPWHLFINLTMLQLAFLGQKT
jgi:hypothetical protein